MRDLPSGTVTLLFTDVEGSTRLLQQVGPDDYGRLLATHHRLLREALQAHAGIEVKTEGDSFFVVFPRPTDAVEAVVRMQRELADAEWPGGAVVRVRMGLHTGEVVLAGDDYIGLDVHRAARISDAAHGGQVLMSETTRSSVDGSLPEGTGLRDMGEHRLKDIERNQHLFQLLVEGLPDEFPALRTLSLRMEILPRDTTEFIGRRAELGRASELLAGTRLLTLTGSAGTGKTRLALQLARTCSASFADGVAFVSLAAVRDPDLLAPTIRHALGLAEEAERTPLETLAQALQHRNMLLVLDNFEQLLPAASVVAELLGATEQLKVLVTSRSRLHLRGEQEFVVPPLAFPTTVQARDLRELEQSEAVALFLQRARASRPDFELTPANAGAIVEICRRLDGLPLALELAASRVKLLPPQALLARLEKRLDILQSSAADLTDRQRTLRGAIDWSHDLLDADGRAMLRRLAIFVGGWTLEAAEEVAVAAGPLSLDTFDCLSALIDHSLVRQWETSDQARFGMLEVIREYGLDQLRAAAELESTAAAHARHFAGLAAEAEAHLTSGPEWLDRLEHEHANMRAALRWLADAEPETALTMAGALWRFFHLRGHLREGAALLREILALPAAHEPSAARAKALIGLAGLVYWQTDYVTAEHCYEEALDIARRLGDGKLEVEAQYSLAYVYAIEHDWDRAVEAYSAARGLYEEQGAELGVAWATMGSGMIATLRGDHEASLPVIEDSRRRFQRLGDAWGESNAVSVAERALMQLGRLDEAFVLNRAFLELTERTQDAVSISTALLDLAALEALAGRYERAARLVGAGSRIIDDSGGQAPPELINRVDPMPALRENLDEALLQALLLEGRQLSTEQALHLAMTGEEQAVPA